MSSVPCLPSCGPVRTVPVLSKPIPPWTLNPILPATLPTAPGIIRVHEESSYHQEMQIKITASYITACLLGWSIKTQEVSIGEGVENRESLYIVSGNVNLCILYENWYGGFLKKLKNAATVYYEHLSLNLSTNFCLLWKKCLFRHLSIKIRLSPCFELCESLIFLDKNS
jgi:hypothetical protein